MKNSSNYTLKLFALVFSLAIANFAFAEPFLENFTKAWHETTPFRSPTKRFLGKNTYNTIYWTLANQGIYINQKEFYDIVMTSEERGFMGYHASGHKFRVFQDIIKITIEEKLGIELKKDFHFFRVPGDPYVNDHPTAHDFLIKHYPINDNLPEQRNQLISTNFTLYNNFDQKYECSIVFFEKALSFKPPVFDIKVGYLFDALGMSKDHIAELFQIGEVLEQKETGTLFQLFDLSHQDPKGKNPYSYADTQTYPAKKKGEQVYSNLAMSDLFLSTFDSNFLSQYRIVVNHQNTLNPFSSLYMRRYDLNEAGVVKEYERKLREAIQKIPSDAIRANIFKQKLENYWHIEL